MTNLEKDREVRARLLELGQYLITIAEIREPDEPSLSTAAVPLPSFNDYPHGIEDTEKLIRLAYNEYNERRLRNEYISDRLFGEPGWDILLDLFIAKLSGLKISITSVCIASQVPPTTALRWLSVLEEEGLICKTIDAKDRRRNWVELTEAGKGSMTAYFRVKGKKKSRDLRDFSVGTGLIRRHEKS
jgi:DNA-binding transcriptional ArsR family regulator